MNVFNWPKTTCGTFCCCSCSFLPPPLSLLSSPTPTRPGAVKTGGRGFVLDHRRWPAPMRRVIDDLLTKYQGQEDMLRLVDHEYAALVHKSFIDPNSLLHPTTNLHISHQLNTTSLNISPETVQVTQQLSDSGSGRDKRRSRQKPVILVGSANRGTTTMVPRYTSPISLQLFSAGTGCYQKKRWRRKGTRKEKELSLNLLLHLHPQEAGVASAEKN
ncbi:uncharacterized protein LOC121202620 isoform X2 [Betta splendens]|uniref:Uncharacterized protein LOC121202620 isoform X2 n=1 Tax=Betta splendens TaxID=158456 RepID=A0A9W2Y589_BETSP|nr:uncharacterized protein LOC121202620 isoform X2 [Betta splendens]